MKNNYVFYKDNIFLQEKESSMHHAPMYNMYDVQGKHLMQDYTDWRACLLTTLYLKKICFKTFQH